MMRHIFIALLWVPLTQCVCIAETGELVLRAVDIDTGKPIAGVAFAVENGYAEDWAVEVGTADAEGVLRLITRKRPGYYYMIWKKPKCYKVVGRDDAYISVVPGGKVTYDFQLRKKPSASDFPRILPLPADHEGRVPPPLPQVDNYHLASVVEDMPGFKGKRVTFWFYPDKQGIVSPELLQQAEQVFLNGRRVAAAVRDELNYFQKAVPEDQGDIDNMQDILVQLGGLGRNASRINHWRFWCRLPGGIPLRQNGYRIDFTGLDGWDLQVPFYLQPTPAAD
jgi:hypothetical protein